ncbi:MAG: DUF5916 domain-containing protein [Acidobacteriota bacterium]
MLPWLACCSLLASAGGQARPLADRVVYATAVVRAPVGDPGLEDPAWEAAELADGFRQREPREGEPASETTWVKVLYDDESLCIAVFCGDSDPGRIRARQLIRDGSFSSDDSFTVVISPSNDRRNGYAFTINPLGVCRDELIGNNGQIRDVFWDGIWRGEARRNPDGWTAEFIIPFRTLQTNALEATTWGINFERFIRRKNEQDAWTGFERIHNVYRLSRGGELRGIERRKGRFRPLLRPYVFAGYSELAGQATDRDLKGGVDGTLNMGNGLQFDFAANPDFSDAPVDAAQLNLSPVSVAFPETRRFFLKRSDVFDFGFGPYMQLFYSRRIGIDLDTGETVPIRAAGKLTGSLGAQDIGLIYAQTDSIGVPGGNQSLVGRIKRNIFKSSYVGAIFADREGISLSSSYNRGYGADFNLNWLGDRLNVRGFYAETGTPGLKGNNSIHFVRSSFRGRLINFALGEQEIEPNYNPEIGFVNVRDTRGTYSSFGLTPRPKVLGIREVSLTGTLQVAETSQKISWVRLLNTPVTITWNNGSMLTVEPFRGQLQRVFSPLRLTPSVAVDPGLYRYSQHSASYTSDPSKSFLYRAGLSWGGLYGGAVLTRTVGLGWRPNPHWFWELNQNWTTFEMPSGKDEAHVVGLRTDYAFNRRVRLGSFWQYNGAQETPLSANLHFGFRYREDSDFSLVYTNGTQFARIGEGNPELLRVKQLAVKLTFSIF